MAENWFATARERVSNWGRPADASPGNTFTGCGGVCVLIPVWQQDSSPRAHQNIRQVFHFASLASSKNLLLLTEISHQLMGLQAKLYSEFTYEPEEHK